MRLRIKFAKTGYMKYIGHLDVMRYFQKAISRAGIPIKYSAGFNPHQEMSFAQPLSVGVESIGEYFDIDLDDEISDIDTDKVVKSLKDVMVDGMDVISAKVVPQTKKENAMSLIAMSKYELDIYMDENADISLDDLYSKLHTVCTNDIKNIDAIIVTKKTKKSVKEVDIKPLIYDLDIKKSGEENYISIEMDVACGSENNLKPDVVMDYIIKMAGYDSLKYHIIRLDMYKRVDDEWALLDA